MSFTNSIRMQHWLSVLTGEAKRAVEGISTSSIFLTNCFEIP